MSYIIVIRKPSNGRLIVVEDYDKNGEDDPWIAAYDTYEEAEKAAANVVACDIWPYSIVEVG